jgi:hypothetical protein
MTTSYQRETSLQQNQIDKTIDWKRKKFTADFPNRSLDETLQKVHVLFHDFKNIRKPDGQKD